MKHCDCIVIGGGPAGMMAAIGAATSGASVLLVEKNERCGRKLLLTGNGRCNITNTCDIDSFLNRFSSNGQFLRDAFKHFFSAELTGFFEKRGVNFKTEDKGRVFPVTERAESIVEVLEEELRKEKVALRCSAAVAEIICSGGAASGVRLHDRQALSSAAIVLATGGISYPQTGSSGDGFRMAEGLGHTVVALRPGLVGLVVEEPVASLQGLALDGVILQFNNGKKKIKIEDAELLFTDYGISGPSALNASSRIIDWLKDGEPLDARIDLFPSLGRHEFDAWFLETIRVHAKKTVKNMMSILLPERLTDAVLVQAAVAPEKRANYITQAERKKLIDVVKAMHFAVTGCLPVEEAMITRGGVSLKEVDPRTMESRLIKKLFFAGEVLDIDADTGGFNLQAAFSTGYLAGMSAAKTKD